MRIVTKQDIKLLFDLISKSKASLGEIKVKSNNDEISMKVTALSNQNKALANASISLIKLKSEYEEILTRLQKQIAFCMGIEPLIGESPDELLNRLSAMSQADLVIAIRSNGLVWED